MNMAKSCQFLLKDYAINVLGATAYQHLSFTPACFILTFREISSFLYCG